MRIPGPDHPIDIEPAQVRVIVAAAGNIIADSSSALVLREASYPPVYYIPSADINLALLTPSEHTSYCPYKGNCTYYSIHGAGEKGVNAVWTYLEPYDAVAVIADHMAFYPDRVDSIVSEPLAESVPA